MKRAVVDTNVLLVANRDHADISEECVITCIEAIDRLRRGGVTVIDAENPPILQAADCKWLNWWQPLSQAGVHFRFVCPEDVGRFYAQKFPDQTMPEFPPDE